MQTDTDVSTQEKTDPETSVNTEQPIQTEEAESTTPVEDINSKSEENVSQNNNINTSKEGTNKKDKPNINEMTKEEKTVACYQHACILYERNEMLTNQAVRERFGLDKNKNSVASRIIAECVERGFLKPYDDENTSRKFTSYLPFYG